MTSQPHHTFLHSWAWGDFNEAIGDKIWRLAMYASNTPHPLSINASPLIAAALVIKVHAKRGNFLFVPQGPIENQKSKVKSQNHNSKFKIYECLLARIKTLAKQEKVNFIRISPLLEDTVENQNLFKNLGFRPAPIHMHAETTWTLDLTSSEDELLMNMRKTTRNLIRRATKEEVEIKMGNSEQDVELFHKLYQETVKKHSFSPFSLTYLKKQVKILASPEISSGRSHFCDFKGESMALSNWGVEEVSPLREAKMASPATKTDVQLFTAYHHSKPLAGAIIVFYGNSAFYHHGASIPSKIPATYLLQWRAICEAKRRGHKFYNFWGIVKLNGKAQMTNDKHPWAGLTLFKTGFGGFQTNYMHAQDLPLTPLYWFNWLIETMRRKKRNL